MKIQKNRYMNIKVYKIKINTSRGSKISAIVLSLVLTKKSSNSESCLDSITEIVFEDESGRSSTSKL